MENILFIGGVGFQEILLIALVVLLFFGGKKIPELMKGLGKGVRSFKEGMNGKDDDDAGNSTIGFECNHVGNIGAYLIGPEKTERQREYEEIADSHSQQKHQIPSPNDPCSIVSFHIIQGWGDEQKKLIYNIR